MKRKERKSELADLERNSKNVVNLHSNVANVVRQILEVKWNHDLKHSDLDTHHSACIAHVNRNHCRGVRFHVHAGISASIR